MTYPSYESSSNQSEVDETQPFSAAELDEITAAAREVTISGDNSGLFELISKIPGSGVEVMMALRGQYAEGDPTPLYIGGALLEQAVRQTNNVGNA